MKKTNKFLSVFLALIMIISIIPMSSITANAETFSGSCGSNLTWTYDNETYTLTISGTGAMYDYYSSLDIPWYNYSRSIKTIVINEGVTRIGVLAFCDCEKLTSVTISDSVRTIGEAAFGLCTSLTGIAIPDSVTTIGSQAFSKCSNLTSVTIPNSVTSIGEATFAGCASLTDITVDRNNQHYLNDEYGVLFNKDKTTLIQYPVGNTRTSYTIPNGVTRIGMCAFALCTSLTNVTIPDSVRTIGKEAFAVCDSLTNVTIPDSVTTIDYGVFGLCTSLTSIAIPDNIATIGENAFYECTNLTDVYYSGTEGRWYSISVHYGNEYFINATIHFNHTEHTDNDSDGSCDECGTFFDPSVECNHNCHKGGIVGFFWKISNFFNRIFGSNKYCECGVAHY